MRTLEKKAIDGYRASVRFIIWTDNPDTEYTREGLRTHFAQAIDVGPWLDPKGEPHEPTFLCFKPGTEEFGPWCERTDGPNYRGYNVKLEWNFVETGKLHAFSNFAQDLTQRFRASPPDHCCEIYTHLDFTTFLGPNSY